MSILCGRSTSSRSTPSRCSLTCVRSHRSRPPRGRGDGTTFSCRPVSAPPRTSSPCRRRYSRAWARYTGRSTPGSNPSCPPCLTDGWERNSLCVQFDQTKSSSFTCTATGTKTWPPVWPGFVSDPTLGCVHLLRGWKVLRHTWLGGVKYVKFKPLHLCAFITWWLTGGILSLLVSIYSRLL